MEEMTADTWRSIISYAQKLYKPVFVLTGGEPLMRDDLFEITQGLRENSSRWGMVSNGMALNQKLLDRLCIDGLRSITLSFDGPEENHLYIRRHPDSFRRVLKAMDLLASKPLEYKDAVTCVYPGNLNKLNETAQILLDHGMTHWRLFRIFPKGKASENTDLIMNYKQSNFMVSWIEENRRIYSKKGLDISFSCEGYLPWKQDRKVRIEPFFCRSGINYASILSDGTVTGCNNNGPAFYQGNIANRDFNEIWEQEFKIYRNPSWRKTGICKDCKEWDFCLGNSVHLWEYKEDDGPGFCYFQSY